MRKTMLLLLIAVALCAPWCAADPSGAERVYVGSTKIVTVVDTPMYSAQERATIVQARLVDILAVLRMGDDPQVEDRLLNGAHVLYAEGMRLVTVTTRDTQFHGSTSAGLARVWVGHLDEVLRQIAPADPQRDLAWLTDYEQGLAAARLAGKPVLIDFTATWCGPCQMLDKETWPHPAIEKLSAGFVRIKVDVDDHGDLARQYQVTAIPLVVFLDAQGQETQRSVGYRGPEEMAKLMTDVLER